MKNNSHIFTSYLYSLPEIESYASHFFTIMFKLFTKKKLKTFFTRIF